MEPHAGTLVLVLGVSGSGKSALLNEARAAFPSAVFPVSCTTRPIRPQEVAGENYYFLTDAEFDARIEAGDFLEWATYGGFRYGTLRSEIVPNLTEGKLVIREVEIQGAHQILHLLPDAKIVTIFIHAGSWETLERRILQRAPMSEEELAKRRSRYEVEMQFANEATVAIENCDGAFDHARGQFLTELRKLATLTT